MKNEDELKAENALLKLKLEMEHGMLANDTSKLDAEMENQWLNNIYDFEKQFQEGRRIKVYDMLGRPDFRKHDELNGEEISAELDRLYDILEENQISFDCICEYEDAVIYRFITEELFSHEMDDIRVEGMTHHFIYEEFHPNHEYDLKRYATEFIEKLLKNKWSPEFDETDLAESVLFAGKEYGHRSFSKIILTFQEAYRSFKLETMNIEHVEFDVEKEFASVRLHLVYAANPLNGSSATYTGTCFLTFKLKWNYWSICGIQLPGFGD